MPAPQTLRVGMVGLGMIFDETYRPFFETTRRNGLYHRSFGVVEVTLAAIASRTGSRAEVVSQNFRGCQNLVGPDAAERLAADSSLDAICIATPDDRHFAPARAALAAGKHVLIEKPSVLSLQELDELQSLSIQHGRLAKVVYHKLLDPDHKKLRTHVVQGTLSHINHGYCSLLEPKSISTGQFAEWLVGRNPATYVAVHYVKLIDFTFGPAWRLSRVRATGQRGIVGPTSGPTFDSVQLQLTFTHADQREATFDIHTSWVTPDNFPGYVEQEVQFRFDNAVWNAHQRKRGVEVTVEDRTPHTLKNTPNHHYNGTFIEPWNEPSQRGYGIEAVSRFFEEVAFVEYGGPPHQRDARLSAMRALAYNDLSTDRNTVAVVQALEAILAAEVRGHHGAVAVVNTDSRGGLVLRYPGSAESDLLYSGRV